MYAIVIQGLVRRNVSMSSHDIIDADLIIANAVDGGLHIIKNIFGDTGPVSEDTAENIIRKHRK